ncbi:hypothetical protein [Pseudomonas aeruginosa]|uniref:hypothetical protein n=1 Tax=Pseudomonas aeruginosa TaxID=287 RepID=UPI0029BFEFBF|nr:hypothetical protein [Pseudomonas aeruginosa]HCF1959547.1 hypothetical protein [Pseudomonas aeruginosa]
MTESKICTCPSGDGSLRWPCPAHPAVDQADVAAKLTFINGRPAMCGCQVEYSDGGGEYSDVIYVTLCAKHSGSAILDLVATNRIALTPEYEGQWHADLYLDREIPLAKVEGATPAEAVIALMSAERIDPEQESVEQAGGDRWDALQSIMEWTASENIPDERKLCLIRNAARAALAQPSPVRSSLLINGYQLRAALDFIAPDGTAEQLESEACIEWRQQDADFLEAGLYAFCAEYPEEGSVLLDEEPTTAQPSPLQSEQAEAERPEVIRVPSCENSYGFGYVDGSCHVDLRKYRNHLEDILDSLPNDEPLMTVSQHDRIVGELRADRDSWAEQAEQRLADWDEMRKERDAALVRVEQQERTIAGMNEAHAKLAGLYEAAQAQHSVPDGASDLCRFLAKLYCELDGLRYSTAKLPAEQIADALIFKWPVLQGARNQLNIKRISEQPYDESKLHSAIAAMLAAAPGNSAQHSVPELLEWAVGRWHAEVSLRPLINVHRRALDDTWRQVIRRLGGDTGLLCGPSHDELLAAAPAQGGE